MENQILEINLISAQGLKTPSSNLRKMLTYALTWVDPAAKLRNRVDSLGGENPTWNDKFLFRVSDEFISGETSTISVEIFAVGYIKDFLIGTVRFLLSTPRAATSAFTAVQIRRPSGRFVGVLNIAATALSSFHFQHNQRYCESEFAVQQRRRFSSVSLASRSGGGGWLLFEIMFAGGLFFDRRHFFRFNLTNHFDSLPILMNL